MNNTIIEFLNLKADEIEAITCHSLKKELIVELALEMKLPCPQCGLITDKVLNQYTRKINHGLFIDRKCIIYYKKNVIVVLSVTIVSMNPVL